MNSESLISDSYEQALFSESKHTLEHFSDFFHVNPINWPWIYIKHTSFTKCGNISLNFILRILLTKLWTLSYEQPVSNHTDLNL